MRILTIAMLAAALPVLSAGSASAQGAALVAEGGSYASARETLMKAGYKPVARETAGRCSALTAVCATYPETSACVPANAGTCRFEWSKAGTSPAAVVIETRGETPERLVVFRSFEGASAASPYPLGTTN